MRTSWTDEYTLGEIQFLTNVGVFGLVRYQLQL